MLMATLLISQHLAACFRVAVRWRAPPLTPLIPCTLTSRCSGERSAPTAADALGHGRAMSLLVPMSHSRAIEHCPHSSPRGMACSGPHHMRTAATSGSLPNNHALATVLCPCTSSSGGCRSCTLHCTCSARVHACTSSAVLKLALDPGPWTSSSWAWTLDPGRPQAGPGRSLESEKSAHTLAAVGRRQRCRPPLPVS